MLIMLSMILIWVVRVRIGVRSKRNGSNDIAQATDADECNVLLVCGMATCEEL